MGERTLLPHDRGHLLWTAEDGSSRMLTSSMDRWTTAIVGDDGIDGPVMGFGEKVTAQVIARADGTIACLLYTSPSPRDATLSRMPSSA